MKSRHWFKWWLVAEQVRGIIEINNDPVNLTIYPAQGGYELTEGIFKWLPQRKNKSCSKKQRRKPTEL